MGGMPTPSRLDHLRVRHLRLLDLISQHGSLTAAAECLGISQPTTTKLLQELERVLRCTLVDRSTRGGLLTDSGRRALERVRPAMHAIDLIPDMVSAAPEHPMVRIGILRLAGISMVPDLVHQLRAHDHLPRLYLQEDAVANLMDQLFDGEIDCIMGRLDPNYHRQPVDTLDITQLGDDPYEIACAPANPLSRKRAVPLSALVGAPWAVAPRGTYTRQAFDMAFMSQGIPAPIPVIESPSFHASFAVMSRNTDFLTIAPMSSVRYYADLGKVRPIRLSTPFPPDRMVFVTRHDLLTIPAVRDIKNSLIELARAAPVPAR